MAGATRPVVRSEWWIGSKSLNKVGEYMAMGKPVVAFDLDEVRDTAHGAAIYVPANDPVDFGDQILRLLESPEERRRMGEKG